MSFALVPYQRLIQSIEHLFLVGFLLHIDKVNDNNTADIAQPNLVGNLFDGLKIGF